MSLGYRANPAVPRSGAAVRRRPAIVLALAAWLFAAFAWQPVLADDQPSAEAKAVARQLLDTIRFVDQFKAIIPTMMAGLKPGIVQGRPDVERDYDAMAPVLVKGFETRIGELVDAVTIVYARTFTIDEMRGVMAFYRSPTGLKLLDKTPALTQATMAAGQQFGRSVGEDLQKRMIEELRKKGHTI